MESYLLEILLSYIPCTHQNPQWKTKQNKKLFAYIVIEFKNYLALGWAGCGLLSFVFLKNNRTNLYSVLKTWAFNSQAHHFQIIGIRLFHFWIDVFFTKRCLLASSCQIPCLLCSRPGHRILSAWLPCCKSRSSSWFSLSACPMFNQVTM